MRALRTRCAVLGLLALACLTARAEEPRRSSVPDPDPGFLEFLGSIDRLADVSPDYLAQARNATLLLAATVPAWAQETPAAPAPGNPPAPVAWSSLSPEQQKLLKNFSGQWGSLPPSRQQALAHGTDRWLGMSGEQRDHARDRFEHFRSLPPEQRHALRSRWQQFQALPPHEQAAVRDNFHRFQQLPPERRQLLRQQWRSATPGERQQMVEHARSQREKEPSRAAPQRAPPHH